LGLVLLSLFVWFAGPYLAFADHKPLESEFARLIAIAVVVALWFCSVILKMWRAARASAKLAQAVVAQKGPATPDGATREAVALRERFEEAVVTLKKTQHAGQTLYELPWYVIIGPPGSGKTTALINSGLKFPLEQRFGKEALRGVGGTRNCDWWFTDEAVLLDTAGRYMTQDSDASADSAGWAEFLNLLTKYRKRRPLNGVIVTLSAQDLMTHTPQEREANVSAARRRLDELNRHLKVRLPVYLMVTKCDLISGFTEYFDDLGAEGRAQVWGMTFTPDRSLAGKASEDFAPEFDALIERLNQRLFGRIEDERDTRRRTAAFAFPQQVAGLRNFISSFVTEVFAATRFDGRLLLRGVYFTSGTQEGTPIDRLIAAIGRGFAATPAAVSASAPGPGKAYFIERLLREVLFTEAGLAGVNQRREVLLAAGQLGVYAALLVLAALGVLVLLVSYSRNKSYLSDVSASLDQLNAVTLPTAQLSLVEMVPGLDALYRDALHEEAAQGEDFICDASHRNACGIVDTAERYRGQLALSLRWGLFQGDAVGEEARGAYYRVLNGALLPKLGEQFRERLQSSGGAPDQLYQYLQAYLMLCQPEHLKVAQLAFLVNLDWQEALAGQPDALKSLTRHLHGLLEQQGRLRPLPIDDALVAQSRNTVHRASLPRLLYNQLRLSHMDDTSNDVRLDIAAGNGAERVLTRKGASLSEPIPGLYTRTVFDQVSALGPKLVDQFSEDSWVMGGALDVKANMQMTADVMDVYSDDYIQTWDKVLSTVQVMPLGSVARAAESLAVLGSPTGSPLKGLLNTVEANTNMSKPPEGGRTAASLAADAEKVMTGSLDKIFGSRNKGPAALTPAQKITAHFAQLNALVTAPPGGAAPIDQIVKQFAQIQQTLITLGPSAGGGSATVALQHSGHADVLKSLEAMASTLPPQVAASVKQVSGNAIETEIVEGQRDFRASYEDVVKACQMKVSQHYPFLAGNSVTDVPLADFGQVFKAGGTFDGFFKDKLASWVDTRRSPWTWLPGAPAAASTDMLRTFEAVQQIRDSFLGASGLPDIQFTVTPGDLDRDTLRFTLELDGQPALKYSHGPVQSLPWRWPGPSPGTAAVTFEDSAGPHPTSFQEGPWAWFRLLDAANVREETPVRFVAAFQNGAHQATVVIEVQSSANAYHFRSLLHQFRCGR